MATRKKTVAEVMEELADKQGGSYVAKASSALGAATMPRLETGVFAVDYLTGGGIPWGATTLLWGVESGGKTLVALKTAAAACRTCRQCVVTMEPIGEDWLRCGRCGSRGEKEDCGCAKGSTRTQKVPRIACPKCSKFDPVKTLWIDPENTFQLPWAVKQGVDATCLHLVQAQSGPQSADAAFRLLQTGEFGLGVLDSIAQVVPTAEMVEDADKILTAPQARLINRFLRILGTQTRRDGPNSLAGQTTFVLTNQVRQKIGVMYGSPDIKPGGLMQNFMPSVILKFMTSDADKDTEGNTIRVKISFRVDKCKVSPSSKMAGNFMMWVRECEIDEVIRQIGDTEEDVVLAEYGLEYKAIVKTGAKYQVAGHTVTSVDAVKKVLRDDWKARKAVREALLPEMLGEVWHSIKERSKK